MEITTVTTKVVWSLPRNVEVNNKINAMVKEAIEAGKLILVLPTEATDTNETIMVNWKDLEAANEYLAFVNALSPVSAEIIEN
jgi:hypothetical protein